MQKLKNEGKCFELYGYDRYTTVVACQKPKSLFGNIAELTKYLLRIQKMNGNTVKLFISDLFLVPRYV